MNIPRPLRQLYRAWMAFSHFLGLIMSSILLTVLWLVAFGIYAIVFKLIRLFARRNRDSEWTPIAPQDAASLRTQY